MFQLFLRARAHHILRHRFGGDEFRARSAERDAKTDRERVESILVAIDGVLRASEDEQLGLSGRVDDVLARAAVTGGTAADEYLDREPHLSHHQALFDTEVANGLRRLGELSTMIGHLKFMKAALLSRFPDLKSHRQSSA
jgi:hypothetical protein